MPTTFRSLNVRLESTNRWTVKTLKALQYAPLSQTFVFWTKDEIFCIVVVVVVVVVVEVVVWALKGLACNLAIYTVLCLFSVQLIYPDYLKRFTRSAITDLYSSWWKVNYLWIILVIIERWLKCVVHCQMKLCFYVHAFDVKFGVRQGSFLSLPFSFALQLDDIWNNRNLIPSS